MFNKNTPKGMLEAQLKSNKDMIKNLTDMVEEKRAMSELKKDIKTQTDEISKLQKELGL